MNIDCIALELGSLWIWIWRVWDVELDRSKINKKIESLEKRKWERKINTKKEEIGHIIYQMHVHKQIYWMIEWLEGMNIVL